MRVIFVTLLIALFVLAPSLDARAASPGSSGTILRVHVTGSQRTVDGTCILVHQTHRGGETTLDFLTSTHLFDHSGPHRVRVQLSAWDTVDVPADGVFVPTPPGEIAILRITTKGTPYAALATVPMVFEPPPTGELFVVAGLDAADRPATAPQHVLFRETRFLVGDRGLSDLHECLGAAALVPGGVVGLVSDCGDGLLPFVALLSPARDFIAAHVPGGSAVPTSGAQYEVIARDVPGPVLTVACDEVRKGEVRVPVPLAPRQMLIDATAEFTNPRSLRLGDISVAGFGDYEIHVRFTMVGTPPPLTRDPGAVCPQGQALVTIKATLVQWP